MGRCDIDCVLESINSRWLEIINNIITNDGGDGTVLLSLLESWFVFFLEKSMIIESEKLHMSCYMSIVEVDRILLSHYVDFYSLKSMILRCSHNK